MAVMKVIPVMTVISVSVRQHTGGFAAEFVPARDGSLLSGPSSLPSLPYNHFVTGPRLTLLPRGQ